MKVEEIFYTLGIEPTKDEAAIKKAYRDRLVLTNPEDNPEGFKLLRQAYEEACVYAKQEDKEEEEEQDTTPSGLWVEKAAKIYKSISARCNVEEWKALFDEEIFVSLDTNEECRIKLLVFIMDHFRFPNDVWELFEKNLCIVNHAKQLKEDFPADFIDYIVQKCNGRESLDYTLFEGPDEGDYDYFLRCYNESWGTLNNDNLEQTQEFLRQADATGITHPYMEITRAILFEKTEKKEDAGKLLGELLEKYPEDETVLYQVGEFYWRNERREEAKDLFLKLKEKSNDNYMANYRLTYYYDEIGDDDAAKECIKIVSRYGCDDAFAALRIKVNNRIEQKLETKWKEENDIDSAIELFKCYLQDETFFKGFKLAQSIENQVPYAKQITYDGLLTRCHISWGKYEDAIVLADKWLWGLERRLPHETGEEKEKLEGDIKIAHEIKLSAYRFIALGKPAVYEKAKREYEILKELGEVDPKTQIEMARVYLETEEYEKCLELSQELLQKYQIQYAYTLMLESYAKMWDASGVINTAKECIFHFPEYPVAYEEAARVFRDLEHPEELKSVLEDAKANNVESIYLDSWYIQGREVPEDFPISEKMDEFDEKYDQKLRETGNMTYYEEGYPIITKYLHMYPCNYILNHRGLFSMAAKKYEEAKKDFERILDDDPADQFGYNNLGCLAKYEEKYEEALVCFEQANRYMYREGKEDPNSYPMRNIANTYELMGEYAYAAKTYEELLNKFKELSWPALKDLTANLARSGQLDRALAIIDEVGDQWYKKYRTLLKYRAYLYAGQWQEAKKFLARSQKLKDDLMSDKKKSQTAVEYYHRLAWYQALSGESKDVFKNLNEASVAAAGYEDMKVRTDILSDKLFLSTLGKYQGEMEGKGSQAANARMLESIILDQELDWLEGRNFKSGKVRDAIYTGEFFYKDRYVMYLEFLVALFTQGIEAGKVAFEDMKNSRRCRLCNHGQCARLVYAEAMLLEMEDKKVEAYKLYADLLEKQPYNMYALAKTL